MNARPEPVCLADIVLRALHGKWCLPILLAIDTENDRATDRFRDAVVLSERSLDLVRQSGRSGSLGGDERAQQPCRQPVSPG